MFKGLFTSDTVRASGPLKRGSLTESTDSSGQQFLSLYISSPEKKSAIHTEVHLDFLYFQRKFPGSDVFHQVF